MTINEKAIYLKGLADGLNYDRESAEGKLIAALIDLTSDMAKKLEEVDDDVEYLNDYIEEIDEDLGDVEEYLYGARSAARLFTSPATQSWRISSAPSAAKSWLFLTSSKTRTSKRPAYWHMPICEQLN